MNKLKIEAVNKDGKTVEVTQVDLVTKHLQQRLDKVYNACTANPALSPTVLPDIIPSIIGLYNDPTPVSAETTVRDRGTLVGWAPLGFSYQNSTGGIAGSRDDAKCNVEILSDGSVKHTYKVKFNTSQAHGNINKIRIYGNEEDEAIVSNNENSYLKTKSGLWNHHPFLNNVNAVKSVPMLNHTSYICNDQVVQLENGKICVYNVMNLKAIPNTTCEPIRVISPSVAIYCVCIDTDGTIYGISTEQGYYSYTYLYKWSPTDDFAEHKIISSGTYIYSVTNGRMGFTTDGFYVVTTGHQDDYIATINVEKKEVRCESTRRQSYSTNVKAGYAFGTNYNMAYHHNGNDSFFIINGVKSRKNSTFNPPVINNRMGSIVNFDHHNKYLVVYDGVGNIGYLPTGYDENNLFEMILAESSLPVIIKDETVALIITVEYIQKNTNTIA